PPTAARATPPPSSAPSAARCWTARSARSSCRWRKPTPRAASTAARASNTCGPTATGAEGAPMTDRFGPLVHVDPAACVHPSAQLYGAVEVAAEASVWPNVVVRAEMNAVRIGARTNVQDFVMIHIGGQATVVGEDCSITHHVTLHGCTIGDRVLVGIGA